MAAVIITGADRRHPYPDMSDHLPITPDEIATASIEAAEAAPPSSIFMRVIRKPASRIPIRTCSCSFCRGSSNRPGRS